MKKTMMLLLLMLLLCGAAMAETDGSFLLREGETLITQEEKEAAVAVLAEEPAAGCRYLRIQESDGDTICSGPLPVNYWLDTYHSGDGELLLKTVQGTTEICIVIVHKGQGRWVCEEVELWHERWMLLKKDGIQMDASAPGRNDGVDYGIWPINMPMGKMLQEADFSSLPMSEEGARELLDTESYAYVNNRNAEDRLHLRTAANQSAASLGKFYNRTPVVVLEKGEQWSLVRIGTGEHSLTGYMMTAYLAFGEQKAAVSCAFPQLMPGEDFYIAQNGPALYEKAEVSSEIIGSAGLYSEDLIIGVHGEDWLTVMTEDGQVGFCRASEFGEGNG
ncbi:MAG: SH3 domain-containing protein [Clostridia bacterium]|nr:SH3 domain-containing protein [Clostridia bacterium]